jgi:hypothetical protein
MYFYLGVKKELKAKFDALTPGPVKEALWTKIISLFSDGPAAAPQDLSAP